MKLNGAYTQASPQSLPIRAGRFILAFGGEPERFYLRRVVRAVGICLLFFVCAESARAVPLSVYHERVRRAIVLIGSIGTALQGEARNRQRDRSIETAALEEARQLIPPNETIEWQGGVLRADNNWFMEALDAYELLPADDPTRTEQLARIAERLQAIDERLTEIEGPTRKATDKDEEKARLAAILRRDEYNRAGAEGNALTRLVKRIQEWLKRLFPKRESSGPQKDSRAVNNTAQVIVSLLSVAVILYMMGRLLPRFLRREMKKRKPKERGARVVLGEQLGADESSADLLAEAETLARSGDLRSAIRKGYVALLCDLHDRKLVRLEQHKTNRDYLRAVQSNGALYEEMKPMTLSFENHWYGFIPATETDWQTFRDRYRKAVTSDK